MSAITKKKKEKIIIIKKKKSFQPRCAIDQNAFRFPGARPNMADAWIRNSDWVACVRGCTQASGW